MSEDAFRFFPSSATLAIPRHFHHSSHLSHRKKDSRLWEAEKSYLYSLLFSSKIPDLKKIHEHNKMVTVLCHYFGMPCYTAAEMWSSGCHENYLSI